MVLKRRCEDIDAMKFKLALLENKSKTKGRAKSKQHQALKLVGCQLQPSTAAVVPDRGDSEESHAKFKTLLKYKMDCVGGRVVECEEEYTSKTCSSCGGIKNDLGGSSTYKCSFCHVVYDRDANVAKSIFHKNVQMLV
ncbi:hypothetical protein BBJ29_000426 [Phytophthora kernoviae]|uniref:Cas12f1-like TNB domain-containing protein n=1 Tax=Phytophthora kernoviae TaxID=325452 RepID=A0A421G0D8_9STRA|nr:hypothetical protein BBJ29_000426 [Phytophthora kernoviae]